MNWLFFSFAVFAWWVRPWTQKRGLLAASPPYFFNFWNFRQLLKTFFWKRKVLWFVIKNNFANVFLVCSLWGAVVCLHIFCFFVCGFFVFVQVFSCCYKFALFKPEFKPKQKTKNNNCGIQFLLSKLYTCAKINFRKLLKLFKSKWKKLKTNTPLHEKRISITTTHRTNTAHGRWRPSSTTRKGGRGTTTALNWTQKTQPTQRNSTTTCFFYYEKLINLNFISFHKKMERHGKAATPTRVKGNEIKPSQLYLN